MHITLQVLRHDPTSRLLLVAPSNLAADLLAQRLMRAGRPRSELLRVCAFSRPYEDLPEDLREVTLWDDAVGAFRLPELREVTANRIRVIVVTALMAGKVSTSCIAVVIFNELQWQPLALTTLGV